MSTQEPSEEELRAAYEAELSKIRIEQVLLEHLVTLINLGMRRTGLSPGTEGERDVDQVRLAIEGVRALVPIVEQFAPDQMAPIRQALSQMQMAYVRLGGAPGPADPASAGAQPAPPPDGTSGPGPGGPSPAGAQPAPPSAPGAPEEPGEPGAAGPAQRSGRLWIPGS